MKYVPGRKYEVNLGKKGKVGGLREERIAGIPHSFQRLDSFLKDKRRDLKDYVRETCEHGAKVNTGTEADEDIEEREQLEVGPEMGLGDSGDEEEFGDSCDEEDFGNESD